MSSPEWHPVASSSLNCSCSSLAFSVTHVCSRNPWATPYSQSRCDGFLSNVVKKSRILIFIHTASGALSSPPATQKSSHAAPLVLGGFPMIYEDLAGNMMCTRLRFFWPVMFAESWTLNDTDGSKTGGKSVVESFVRRYGEAVRRQRLQDAGETGGGRNSSATGLTPYSQTLSYLCHGGSPLFRQ
jgi:hypothetical protein